jgi:hypothetical protein
MSTTIRLMVARDTPEFLAVGVSCEAATNFGQAETEDCERYRVEGEDKIGPGEGDQWNAQCGCQRPAGVIRNRVQLHGVQGISVIGQCRDEGCLHRKGQGIDEAERQGADQQSVDPSNPLW